MKNAKNAVPNERLREVRELRGWPRNYVADRICSDSNTIARWERGITFPSPYYRQRLCELFEMSAKDLGIIPGDVKNSISDQDEAREKGLRTEKPPLMEQDQFVASDFERLHVGYSRSKFLSFVLVTLTGFSLLLLFSWKSFAFSDVRLIPMQPTQAVAPSFPNTRLRGGWISPKDGQRVQGILYLSVKVYSSGPGNPIIDHVDFFAQWSDRQVWIVTCIAYPPQRGDIFSCNIDLRPHNVPAGKIRVDFDIYDQLGSVDTIPDGIRTIIYSP